jgi:hypothetical protein
MHDYKDAVQTPHDQFPTAALRLKRLEQYFAGWEHLDHDQQERIELPDSYDCFSDRLSGGLYAYKYTHEGRKTIGFVELPSRTRQTQVTTWSHEDAFDVAAFAMLRSEDLLVVLEVYVSYIESVLSPHSSSRDSESNGNLHLRTLSSNEPHPKARCPILVLGRIIYPSGIGIMIQILGDSIAIVQIDVLMVWNWHSGDVLYVRRKTWALDIDLVLIFSLFQPAAEYRDRKAFFLLVEPKMVLIPQSNKEGKDSLSVYEILDSDLRLLISLELPVLTTNGRQGPLTITMNREIPLLNQATSSLTPFDTSNARVLHFDAAMDIHYSSEPDLEIELDFDLFVPISTILRYARSRGPGTSKLMQWSEWSPNTSLLIASPKPRWDSYVYGSRFAYISDTMGWDYYPGEQGVDTTSFLTVIDFTPHPSLLSSALRFSPQETTSETEAADSVPNEEDWKANAFEIFGAPMKFSLTRRKIEIPLRMDVEKAIIDDEHIILVSLFRFVNRPPI